MLKYYSLIRTLRPLSAGFSTLMKNINPTAGAAFLLPPTPENITKAASRIKDGLLVSFSTETVYGLGANGLDPDAALRIFQAKGR